MLVVAYDLSTGSRLFSSYLPTQTNKHIYRVQYTVHSTQYIDKTSPEKGEKKKKKGTALDGAK